MYLLREKEEEDFCMYNLIIIILYKPIRGING